MGLLNVGNISRSFGEKNIFSGVSFEIEPNDRVGLVGCNGSGKTTLFKILTGELEFDGGTVSKANRTECGYMEQHVCRDLDRSAFEELLTVFDPLLKLEAELESVARQLNGNSKGMEALIERQAVMNEQFVRQGGLEFRSRARSALLGLGFSEDQLANPVGVLSGGQRAKIQLAKMLLCGANLLLLDEPTNHLDIPSVEWLEDFLRSFSGAYIVISHDRYFLDRVTNRTFELSGCRLIAYKGNYSTFLAQKEENGLASARKYENTKKEIRRIEGIVEQQRRWNREKNIKTAESKLKVIERLESTLEEPQQKDKTFRFRFGISQRSGNDVLTVENLAVGFSGKEIIRNVDMEIHRQERVFLIGPNGCGKTTLLRTLLGTCRQAEGTIRFGTGLDLGYYDQLQAGLREDKRVIDEIWDYYPQMTETEVRSALAIFLFQGEEVFKAVSALSGGERARVLLLRLMLSKNNFLLLDEPTNHLDIQSCEALENALKQYEGTLLIVSHDRYLINKIADRIYALSPDGVRAFEGNYDAYLEKTKESTAEKAVKPAKNSEYAQKKEREAATRKEKAELRRLEVRINESELEISKLEDQLQEPETASDYQAAMEITEKIEKMKHENEDLVARWSALAEKYEDI
jgi:ATP-binding cassette subfamily F protein 3